MTDFTAITLAHSVMNDNVTLLFEPSFGTMLVRAELLTSVHRLWFFDHNNQILPDERFYFNFLCFSPLFSPFNGVLPYHLPPALLIYFVCYQGFSGWHLPLHLPL